MIVTCDQCDTQFRLDDARIPASGLRVRCSLCKHAFDVEATGASVADRIHELANEAIERVAGAAPQPTRDLEIPAGPGAAPPGRGGTSAESAAASTEFELESDWQFNDDTDDPPLQADDDPFEGDESPFGSPDDSPFGVWQPTGDEPALAPEQAPEEPLPTPAPGLASAQALAPESDGLGSSEDWDLLTQSNADDLAARAPLAFRGPSVSSVGARPLGAGEAALAAAAALEDEARALLRRWLRRAGEALGWTAVASLVGVALAFGLAPAGTGSDAPTAESGPGRIQEVAGLSVDGVRAQWVENALAGPLYVVSGRLHNASPTIAPPGGRVGLRLLAASGTPLEVPATPLGPTLAPGALREWDPQRIREALAQGAERRAGAAWAPGQLWRFEAVLTELPPEAAGFRFEALPAPPRPRSSGKATPGASPPRSSPSRG